MNKIVSALLAVFFGICVLVHVFGLFYHVSDETILSHFVHIFSYSICLFAVVKNIRYRLLAYWMGSAYPFVFHAICLYKSIVVVNQLSTICLLVVVLLPAAGGWIWLKGK